MARIQDALLSQAYSLDNSTVFVPHEYFNGKLEGSVFDASSGEYQGNNWFFLQNIMDDNIPLFESASPLPKESDLAKALQAMKKRKLESLPFEESLAKISQ